MFEQFVEGVRKASESSFQLQQELVRNWTRQWTTAGPMAGAVSTPADPMRGAQKRWLELGLEMLNKHREALDATSRAGIQLIEQAFHVGDAKNPEDFRHLVEDLWRKLFDLQKQQAESQFRDVQSWIQKSTSLAQDARS